MKRSKLNETMIVTEFRKKVTQLCQLIDIISYEEAIQLIHEMEALQRQLDPHSESSQHFKALITDYKLAVLKYFKKIDLQTQNGLTQN